MRRLRAIGLRPISALVDITNFITMSYGRPLHVFDADKLNGTVHARLARDGETIEALDGKAYALDSSDDGRRRARRHRHRRHHRWNGNRLQSRDDERLPEAAYFDPIRTAATGQARDQLRCPLPLRARRRPGLRQARRGDRHRMILDLCGGEASELVVAGRAVRSLSIPLRLDQVKTLAGVDIPPEEQIAILEALGFVIAGAGSDIGRRCRPGGRT